MTRIYHHYEKWEDWRAGMYKNPNQTDIERLIYLAKDLLADVVKLHEAMLFVALNWTCAAEENMSNKSRNRRAWLGQAACCYKWMAPESITKVAWRLLSEEQQQSANDIATQVIKIWESKQLQNA